MSRPCGHPLLGGGQCTHPVKDPQRPDCGRHYYAATHGRPHPRGCHMTERTPGAWVCLTHGGTEWHTAQALGAVAPCQIPLGVRQRTELAAAADLDPGTAAILVRDPNARVQAALAVNPAVPPDLLRQFAREHPDSEIYKNPSLPATAVVELLKHTHRAFLHLNVPESILRSMLEPANAQQTSSAQIAIQNPSVPQDILLAWVNGTATRRHCVVHNPQLSPDHLRRLYETATAWGITFGIASHVNTPIDILADLAAHGQTAVRGAVAGNVAAPPDILEGLLYDSCPTVRRHLASNPNLPDASLSQLLIDPNGGVRNRAAKEQQRRHSPA